MKNTFPAPILFVALLLGITAPSAQAANVATFDTEIKTLDAFILFLSQGIQALSTLAIPSKPGSIFELYTSVELGNETVVQLRPHTAATYNLTVNFNSVMPWNFSFGVFTKNRASYAGFTKQRLAGAGYVIEFLSGWNQPPGSWSFIFNIKATSLVQEDQARIGTITLPSVPNPVALVILAGGLAYPNMFLLVDAYFRSKREALSKRRLFAIGLAMTFTLIVFYEAFQRLG
jgi:hypothetical protein